MASEDKKDLQLYYRIAKNYAFELPNELDRVKALKWIKKIDSSKVSQKLQTHAIFLLIHSLSRKRLVGPFEQMPKDEKEFSKYKWAFQPSDISKLLVQQEFEKAGKPLISLDISGDLCEICAYQEIPSFGAHFFYAYSPEKLGSWDNTDTSIIPKGLLNLTVISRPDLSILHKSLEVEMASKSKMRVAAEAAANAKESMGEFCDVSVLDTAANMKEGFLCEQPTANEALHMDALQMAQRSGIIADQDLIPEKDMMPQGEQIISPHMEQVSIVQNQRNLSVETRAKRATNKDIDNLEKSVNMSGRCGADDPFAQAKIDMLSRLPARLRERLARKFIPEEQRKYPGRDPNVARTPEIFRKGAKGPFRKFKLEEFGLEKREPFRPAHEVFRDLEYQPPEHRRRSPMAPRVPKPPVQTIQGYKVDDQGVVQDRRLSDDIQQSWDKSWERWQAQNPDPISPIKRRSSAAQRSSHVADRTGDQSDVANMTKRRKCLLQRLAQLREGERTKVVFDDVDVELEPEEVAFERFIFQELPEESGDVTILDDEEMSTDDIFGSQRIADVGQLPKPPNLEELEAAEILLEHELEIDDIFAEDQIMNPDVAFREVAIDKQRMVTPCGGGTPQMGTTRVGRRVLSVPGHEPIVQEFVQELGDPANMTAVRRGLLQRLEQLQEDDQTGIAFDEPSPRPCASKFRRDMQRIDRGEEPRMAQVGEGTVCDPSTLSELGDSANMTPVRRGLLQRLEQLKEGDQTGIAFGEPSPRPWASKFRRDMQRIERGEEPSMDQVVEGTVCDASILSEGQMYTEDMFGSENVCTPSPVLAARQRREGARMAGIRQRAEQIKAQRQLPCPQLVEQDFLEPFYNESLAEDQPGLMDMSLESCQLGAPLIGAPTPVRRNLLEDFERQMDESLRQYSQASDDGRERLQYDPDFLERRMECVPADESIIPDDELTYDDVFGNVETPMAMKDIPMPKRPSPPKGSPFYRPRRLRMEDFLPGERLDDQSCPYDELLESGAIPGGPEDYLDEIEAPELASGVDSDVICLGIDHGPDGSILQSHEMETSDLFNEDQIAEPSRRRIDTRKLAVARSMQQSVEVDKIKNRFRQLQGLPPITCSRPSRNVERILEESIDLMDAVGDQSYQEPEPGLLDQSIPEGQQRSPLIRRPQNVDPFYSFECQMVREMEQELEQADSILAEDEMEDMFEDSMIAEPVPMRQIPMPCPRAKSPSPIQHSHLYRMQPAKQTALADRVPIERISEVSMDELCSGVDTGDYNIMPDIGDESMPSMVDDTLNVTNMTQRLKALRNLRSPGSECLASHEMQTDDLFGPEAIMSPDKLKTTPTKMILSRSIKATQDFQKLRNRMRAMRGMSPLPEQEQANIVQDMLDREYQLLDPLVYGKVKDPSMGVLDASICDGLQKSPLIPSPSKRRRPNPFASFEREMDAQQTCERSYLIEGEMSDMFGEDMIATPPHITTMPMPAQRRPAAPIAHSHLYRVNKPERKKLTEMLPVERIDECSFPGADSMNDSYIPSGYEEQLAMQGEPSTLASGAGTLPSTVAERTAGDSILQDFEMLTDDVFGVSPVAPPNWPRKTHARIALEEGIRQSKRVQDLRNRFRQMQGLPSIAADVSDDRVQRMQTMVEQIEKSDHVEPDAGDESTERPVCDPFGSFEQEMDQGMQEDAIRRMYGSSKDYLTEGEMEDMDELWDVCTPPRMKDIPMPCPRAPVAAAPPAGHSHLSRLPARRRPRMEDMLPVERVDEESFPCVDDSSYLDFVPEGSPIQLEDISAPAGMTEDTTYYYDEPEYDERADLSPTRVAVAKAIKHTMEVNQLKDKFRRMKGLSPERHEPHFPQLNQYLAQADQVEEEATAESQPPCDYFESFERMYDEQPEQFYSNLSQEPSILQESQMEDMFGSGMVAEPVPMADIPMPVRPRPVTPAVPGKLHRHLDPRYKPYRRDIMADLPVEMLDEEELPSGVCESLSYGQDAFIPEGSMLDDEQLPSGIYASTQGSLLEDEDFPSEMYSTGASSSPQRRTQTPCPSSVPRPQTHCPSSPQRQQTPCQASAQDYLQFDDSIGPVQYPEQVARKRFDALAGVADESLQHMTPPSFGSSMGDFIPPAERSFVGRLPCPAPRRSPTPRRPPITMEQRFQQIAAGPAQQRIPLDIAPDERIRRLIAQQPKVEVKPLPRKTGFSPLQFETRVIPREDSFLDAESFPDGIPDEDLFDVQLNSMDRALYVPTQDEEEEMARQQAVSPMPMRTPPRRAPLLPDASPIGRTDVRPCEEGFKWLDNFVPADKQWGAIPRQKPPPKTPRVAGLQHRRARMEAENQPTPPPAPVTTKKPKKQRPPPRVAAFGKSLAAAPTPTKTPGVRPVTRPGKLASNVDMVHRQETGKEVFMKKAEVSRLARPSGSVCPAPSRVRSARKPAPPVMRADPRKLVLLRPARPTDAACGPTAVPSSGIPQPGSRIPPPSHSRIAGPSCAPASRIPPPGSRIPKAPSNIDRNTVIRRITSGIIGGGQTLVKSSQIQQQSDAVTQKSSVIKINKLRTKTPGGDVREKESVMAVRRGPGVGKPARL